MRKINSSTTTGTYYLPFPWPQSTQNATEMSTGYQTIAVPTYCYNNNNIIFILMKSDLPIVDLGPLRTLPNQSDEAIGIGTAFELNPEQKEVATQIHSACRTHGFFYVSNHGISPSLVQQTFQSTRQFFSLPSSEKSKLSSKNSPLFRGYISTSDGLHTCNSKKKAEVGLDQKESFTIGAVGEGPMRGDNQWPENEGEGDGDCDGEGKVEGEDSESNSDIEKRRSQQFQFREVLEEYWEAQIVLCRVIARGLALS